MTIHLRRQTCMNVYVFLITCLMMNLLVSQNRLIGADDIDNELVNQYIQSKGQGIIVFNASNIKQFWVDYSVISQNNSIIIDTSKKTPYKIQFANVSQNDDCLIEVLTDTADAEFTVINSKKKVLSHSSSGEKFVQYNVLTSTIHMIETDDLSFSIEFSTNGTQLMNIKAIVLSFSKNTSFSNPKIKITETNVTSNAKTTVTQNDSDSFIVSGARISVTANDKIYLSDKPLCASVKIKNIGDMETVIHWGYQAFSDEIGRLKSFNYPYLGLNNILTVISSEGNKIVVDKYSKWGKNCYIALNAKDDMSDIPSNSFVDGKIVEIKELENGGAEILLDKPLNRELEKGLKIRIHGINGGYLYSHTHNLKPGEEFGFASQIKKDDESFLYSPESFPRGVSYVLPIILSYSVDSNESNTILVRDFSISY